MRDSDTEKTSPAPTSTAPPEASVATGRRITDLLTREEIRRLTRTSDWQGTLSVATTWGIIAFAFALVAAWPHPLTVVIAITLLGGRQLALAILMHDASHRSLFASRHLNDWAGKWLCAAPAWLHLHKYRRHHLVHHAHTGTEHDNDLGLVAPFPTSKASMVRKFARDLSGIAGTRRIIAQLAMDLGFYTYSASTGARPIDTRNRTWLEFARTALGNLGPMVLTNGLLFGLLFALGHGRLYWLWVIAYLTTFSLFIRIRSMAEHACTEDTADQLRNSRTTRANWLARLTVAPHRVNYHLEHHALMTVPHYHLKAMHELLLERDVFDEVNYAPGYWTVLRKVGSGPEALATPAAG